MSWQDVYSMLYSDPAPAHERYGRGLSRCEDFIKRIRASGLRSILSLGCGSGDELHALSQGIPHCRGIDFALPPFAEYPAPDRSIVRVHGDLTTWTPSPEDMTDAVVSFDVLEHLHESDIDRLLCSIRHAAPRACLVIANMIDIHLLPDGRIVDLHLIQQPPEWWSERIARVTGWPVEIQRLDGHERFGLWCGEWP